jgi:RecG-like helicase
MIQAKWNWFQGHKWIRESLKINEMCVIFKKCTAFGSNFNMAHPEIELLSEHEKAYDRPCNQFIHQLKP